MLLLWRLGWRNLARNRRRSFLSIGAVAAAFGVLIVLLGLTEGMERQTVDHGTRLLLGHVEIHHRDYLPGRAIEDWMAVDVGGSAGDLLQRIQQTGGVVGAAPRLYGFGLLSTGRRSVGARLMGIDPELESRVTTLLGALTEGTPLTTSSPRPVVLGAAIAEELGAQLGEEIAIVTQAADGSLGNDLFRLEGVFETGLSHVDRSLALLRLPDLQELLVLEGRIHEVALRLEDARSAPSVATVLERGGELPEGAAVVTWSDLAPQLLDYLAVLQALNWVTVLIPALFVSFGVLNTMLMAVFERTHELGVLAALGVRPRQVLGMIVAESFCIAWIGLVTGLVAGASAMAYLTTHGWDLRGLGGTFTIAGVLFDPVLRAVWNWPGIAGGALTLVAVTVAAGFLPAWRASRLKPVTALAAPVE